MKRSNLEKLKRDYDGQPEKLQAAVDAAAVELDGLQARGINKENQARAEFLLDLLDYASMPTDTEPRTGGFRNVGGTVSEDEALHNFGTYLQRVAAASLEPGRMLGGEIPTGVISRDLYGPETRATGLAESTPSTGGFLVGTDYSRELFQKTYDASVIWKRTRQFKISSNANAISIPGIDETSRADGSRQGGIRTYWLSEAGTKTASKPTFRAVEMSLKKIIGLCYSSDELLDDASLLAEVITTGFKNEFSFKLDDAVICGTGAGQPLGILNGPSLVTCTAASSAGTLLAADVISCYARLWLACDAAAEWFGNRNILPQLMTQTLGDNPLWLPGGQLRGTPYATLLGKPIHFVETASSLGTAGDLMLLDLSQYGTATKGGLQQAVSIHVAYVTDETAFRFVMRVDGQSLWNSVLTPYKGSGSLGPFVTIATRT